MTKNVQVPSTNFEVFVYCFSGVDNDSRRSFCSKRCKKGRKMKTQYGSVYSDSSSCGQQCNCNRLGLPVASNDMRSYGLARRHAARRQGPHKLYSAIDDQLAFCIIL